MYGLLEFVNQSIKNGHFQKVKFLQTENAHILQLNCLDGVKTSNISNTTFELSGAQNNFELLFPLEIDVPLKDFKFMSELFDELEVELESNANYTTNFSPKYRNLAQMLPIGDERV